MEASTIHHKLDLVIQLVDTTTGVAVTEQNVHFLVDDAQIWPIQRGNGNFVFLNTGRRDFTLTMKVYGYEDAIVEIMYDKLDEVLPLKQVFLIPSEKLAKGSSLCSLTGTLQGLEEIEAVSLSQSNLTYSEFDARKCLLKLFLARGRLGMENVHYGIIHDDRTSYEHIEVAEELPPNTVRLKEPLKETFTVNSPIARVIFGKVSEGGTYLLRVRDDARTLEYLVRYRLRGEDHFKVVDFHDGGELSLP